jgi:2-polyprenyl-3-methyl-5-hydroxy-6-metoxy-1,4-benzoquinol methylase
MAARSWDVEGVEISQSPERITDFRVYGQEFQDIPVNEPVYDAVTAWAVLEHVHDPMPYFRKASEVVKKGGLFVFSRAEFSERGFAVSLLRGYSATLVFLYQGNGGAVP